MPLRGLGAAGLLLAVVGSVAIIAPAAASADPKAVPHTTGAPLTAHDAPGFPGTSTTAPFNECPQIGYAASCGLLIAVSNNGEQVLQDNNNAASGVTPNPGQQMPFDNIDDTLVGIVNTSSKPIYGIQLSGASTQTPIFGFEGDGICTYATGGSNTNGTGGGGSVGGVRGATSGLHGRHVLQPVAAPGQCRGEWT